MDLVKESSFSIRLFNLLFGWFLSHFRYSLNLSRAQLENRPVIYCLINATFLEHLILKVCLLRSKLPAVRGSLFPSLVGLNKKMQILESRQSVLLIMSDREREKLTHAEKLFIRLSNSKIKEEVLIIPLFLSWEAKSEKSGQSLKKLIFGTVEKPSFIKKLYLMLGKRGSALLKNLPEIKFHEYLEAHGSKNLERKCNGLRRKIVIDINDERKVTYGPIYHSTHFVADQIIYDQSFQAWLKKYCLETRERPSEVVKKVRRYIKEIAADQDWWYVRLAHRILDWRLGKAYNQLYINEESLFKIRELAKKHTIVFIPNHTSHFDYLLVGYALASYKMSVPHTAAGINMNFFPMGFFFRKCGAYFLRRTFKDNRVYSEVFRKYVQFLIQHRFNQQFFIEGTRSRIGKLLPPKYGMLKFFAESYDTSKMEDILLAPVSISYDQVLELGSYMKEQEGAKKEKESLTGLLQARKKLKAKNGNAYLNFSEPISLKETLIETYKHDNVQTLSKTDLDYLLQKIAFRTLNRINRGMTVTPTSLICLVLLQGEHSAKPREQVIEESTNAYNFLATPQFFGETFFEEGFKKNPSTHLSMALDLLIEKGIIKEEYDLYHIPENKKPMGGFYKNNSIQFFVTPALLYQALKDPECRSSMAVLEDRMLEYRDLFKFEFFFSSTKRFKKEIRFLLRKIYNLELNFEDPALPIPLPEKSIAPFLDQVLLNFAESYWCTFHTLMRQTEAWSENKMLNEIRYTSKRMRLQGTLQCPESINDFTYKSALTMAMGEGFLERTSDKMYKPLVHDLNTLKIFEDRWYRLCQKMKEDFK